MGVECRCTGSGSLLDLDLALFGAVAVAVAPASGPSCSSIRGTVPGDGSEELGGVRDLILTPTPGAGLDSIPAKEKE